MAEPAPREHRGDHEHETAPADVATTAPPATEATRNANAAGADTAARGELSWGERAKQAWNDVGDWAGRKKDEATQAVEEAARFEFTLPANEAIRKARTFVKIPVVLDAAADSTNLVTFKIDTLAGTAQVIAPMLDVNGATIDEYSFARGEV